MQWHMLNTLNALFSATTVLFHLFKYEYFAQCRLLALITLELNFNSEHNEHFFHLRLVKLIWGLKTLFFSSCIPIKTLGKKMKFYLKGKLSQNCCQLCPEFISEWCFQVYINIHKSSYVILKVPSQTSMIKYIITFQSLSYCFQTLHKTELKMFSVKKSFISP